MSMHPSRNLFAEFKGSNKVFVETGSYRGDGVQLAIDAGYERIFSIDNDPSSIAFCTSRFALKETPEESIRMYCGDSAECLCDVIRYINEPVTFWLDSHWQMLEGTEPGANPWPLLKELGQIGNHAIKNHTILIDDMMVLTHPDTTDWDLDLIKDYLWMINPKYKIEYFANPIINNILVASV